MYSRFGMKTVRPYTKSIGGRAFPSGATIHHKASAARSGWFYDRQKDAVAARDYVGVALTGALHLGRHMSFLIVLGPLIIEPRNDLVLHLE